MIISYLRSSSIGAWHMCRFQYYLVYVLGLPNPGNVKTDLGSMVHKALELLARRKWAEQGGPPPTDPDSGETFDPAAITRQFAVDRAWAAYRHLHPFTADHYRELGAAVDGVLAGPFSPLGLDIVQPEQFFDLEIPDPWGRVDFVDPHTGQDYSGQISIKGAMDLVVRDGPGVLSYVDWKTGARMCWATRKVKDFDYLMGDRQLLLYYYALRRLYPGERVLMNIYFTRDGGPFTLPFGDPQYEAAERMLRGLVEEIRAAGPDRIMGTPRGGPCRSFCAFGTKYGPHAGRPSKCDYYWAEVQELGMDRVVAKHGKPGHAFRYGGGGGVTSRDPAAAPLDKDG